MVAGNTSILPFYFRDTGPVLVVNESLVAELTLSSHGRIWEIHISGKYWSVLVTVVIVLVIHLSETPQPVIRMRIQSCYRPIIIYNKIC